MMIIMLIKWRKPKVISSSKNKHNKDFDLYKIKITKKMKKLRVRKVSYKAKKLSLNIKKIA